MPEAHVALGESKRTVGKLRFETDGRRQHSQFEYAGEWISADDGFALSPSPPSAPGVITIPRARETLVPRFRGVFQTRLRTPGAVP